MKDIESLFISFKDINDGNGDDMIQQIANVANRIGLGRRQITKVTVKKEFGKGITIKFHATEHFQVL